MMVNKCLFCNCQNEEWDSSIYVNSLEGTKTATGEEVCSKSTSIISKNLHIVFILRTILELPAHQFARYLWASPDIENWNLVCQRCNKLVAKCERIYGELQQISRKFNQCKLELINAIKKLNITEESRPRNHDCEDRIKECQTFVASHNYGIKLINPFVEGDLQACRMLSLQQSGGHTEKVTTSEIIVKEEVESETDNDDEWLQSHDNGTSPSGFIEELASSSDDDEWKPNVEHRKLKSEKSQQRRCMKRPTLTKSLMPRPPIDLNLWKKSAFPPECRVESCTATFSERGEYIAHMKGHTEEERKEAASKRFRFFCQEEGCGKVIWGKNRFRGHVARHYGKKKSDFSLENFYLNQVSKTESEIPKSESDYPTQNLSGNVSPEIRRRKSSMMRASFPPKCRVEGCPATFSGRTEHTVHMKGHTEDERKEANVNRFKFYCPEKGCGRLFWGKSRLASHLAKYHKQTRMEEPNLKESEYQHPVSERKSQISKIESNYEIKDIPKEDMCPQKVHKMRARPSQVYKCRFCEQEFDHRSVMRNHEKKIHRSLDSLEVFKCDKCPFQTVYKGSLLNHQGIHNPDRETKRKGYLKRVRQGIQRRRRRSAFQRLSTFPPTCRVPGCTVTFVDKLSHTHHMKTHTDDERRKADINRFKFFCPEEGCGKLLWGKSRLANHIAQYHRNEQPQFQCEICQSIYFQPRNLKIHKRSVHGITLHSEDDPEDSGPEETKQENKIFPPKRKRRGSYPPQCRVDGCNEQFVSEVVYQTHMEGHTEVERRQAANKRFRLSCPERGCDRKIWGKKRLQSHLAKYHRKEEPQYICEMCGKGFYEMRYLSTHKGLVHGERAAKPRLKSTTERICEICGKTFPSMCFLNVHKERDMTCKLMYMTEAEATVGCDICGKRFSYDALLQKHIRQSHEGKFREYCEICGKGFESNVRLQRHLGKTHNVGEFQERKYQCPVEGCGRMLKNKVWLEYHAAQHRGEEPKFKCQECGKGFYFPQYLWKHKASVH